MMRSLKSLEIIDAQAASKGCRHDEIRDLVIWSSLLNDVDMMRSEISSIWSSLLKNEDRRRSGDLVIWTSLQEECQHDKAEISSSEAAAARMKSTWRDQGILSELIISSIGGGNDEIRDLAIWSVLLKDVDMIMIQKGILPSGQLMLNNIDMMRS